MAADAAGDKDMHRKRGSIPDKSTTSVAIYHRAIPVGFLHRDQLKALGGGRADYAIPGLSFPVLSSPFPSFPFRLTCRGRGETPLQCLSFPVCPFPLSGRLHPRWHRTDGVGGDHRTSRLAIFGSSMGSPSAAAAAFSSWSAETSVAVPMRAATHWAFSSTAAAS